MGVNCHIKLPSRFQAFPLTPYGVTQLFCGHYLQGPNRYLMLQLSLRSAQARVLQGLYRSSMCLLGLGV